MDSLWDGLVMTTARTVYTVCRRASGRFGPRKQGVSGAGSVLPRRAAETASQAWYHQLLSWGCWPAFVDFYLVAGFVEMRCAAMDPCHWGRPCLERVTGIEPAFSAWKAD